MRVALVKTLAGGIGVQLTLVVTGIVVARALGPEDRGYLALLALVWATATQLGGFGIPFGLSFAAARVPEAAASALSGVARALRAQLALALLLSAAALAALTWNDPGYVRVGALLAVGAIAPAVLQQCGLSLLQGIQEFTPFNVLRVLPNLLFAAIATVLLAVGTDEFLLFAGGWALSRSVFWPVTLRYAERATRRREDPAVAEVSPALVRSVGRRSLLGGAQPLETYRVDQTVVAIFLSASSLGFYVVSLAFVNLPRFIASSLGLATAPSVASHPDHRQALSAMWRIWLAAIPAYALPILLLWWQAEPLTELLFGTAFAPSAEITRIMLLATVFFCARRLLSDLARAAGWPGVGSVAEVVAVAAAVPMLAVLVPALELEGVAWTMVAASALALCTLLVLLLWMIRAGEPAAWSQSRRADISRVRPGPSDL